MNKKLLSLLLVAAMAVTALAACGKEEREESKTESSADTTSEVSMEETSSEPEHIHEALSEEWEFDNDTHFHTCECGEKIDVEEHELEDGVCETCEVEVYEYDDGTVEVVKFNEYYDVVSAVTYDEDGEEDCVVTYEYEYDEEGNKLEETCYVNGELDFEDEYVLDSDGYSYVSKSTYYLEDGNFNVIEYNEMFEPLKDITYDAEGNVLIEIVYEYEYDENGYKIGEKIYEGEELVEEIEYIVDEYGISYALTVIYYVEGVKAVTENTYDDEFYITLSKIYADGVLVMEYEYSIVDEFDLSYIFKMIEYNEDGSKSVIELDENGEIVTTTVYDSEGNIVE